jgi:hypothetical protein
LTNCIEKYDADAALMHDFSGLYVDAEAYILWEKGPRWKQRRLRFSAAHELGHYILHREIAAKVTFKNFGEFAAWTKGYHGQQYTLEHPAARRSSRRRRLQSRQRMHVARNPFLAMPPGNLQIIVRLNPDPQFGRDVKQATELQRHFRADTPLAPANQADGNGRRADGLGDRVGGQAHRLDKILAQHVARMHWVQSVILPTHKFSVIVRNFNLLRVAVAPFKTNPPLVIDADAVLAFAPAFQGFQPVARRHGQVMQRPRAVDIFQLAPRRVLDVRRQSPRAFPAKDFSRLRTSETDNHRASISHGDNKSRLRTFLVPNTIIPGGHVAAFEPVRYAQFENPVSCFFVGTCLMETLTNVILPCCKRTVKRFLCFFQPCHLHNLCTASAPTLCFAQLLHTKQACTQFAQIFLPQAAHRITIIIDTTGF